MANYIYKAPWHIDAKSVLAYYQACAEDSEILHGDMGLNNYLMDGATEDNFWAWIASVHAQYEATPNRMYFIVEKDTGIMAGTVAIRPDADEVWGHIGLTINPNMRYRGLGKSVLYDVTKRLKSTYGLTQVFVAVDGSNWGSNAMVGHLGGRLHVISPQGEHRYDITDIWEPSNYVEIEKGDFR